MERTVTSNNTKREHTSYLRVDLSPSIHFSTRTQLGVAPRHFCDNRSFRNVKTSTTRSLYPPPRPPAHQVIRHPDSLLPGCLANLLLTNFLASGSGRLSDFFLGDLTTLKSKSRRVVVQVARPGYNIDDEDRNKDKRLAFQVEERLLHEARMYRRELLPLAGKFVTRPKGLWVGHIPVWYADGINRYTKEKLVFLITEYLPFSYQEMIIKFPIPTLPPADLPPCPASFPQALWSQLPPGLRECYLAIQEAGIAHNKYESKHWRGDAKGRWRLIDFSKAYPEDRLRSGKLAKVKKTVTIDPKA